MSRHDNEDRVYGTAQSARRCAVAFGVDRLVASGGPAWGRTVILVDALALTTWLCPDFVSDNVLVRCSFILSIVLVHHCLVTSFPPLWKVERSQFGPSVPYPILSQS